MMSEHGPQNKNDRQLGGGKALQTGMGMNVPPDRRSGRL